MRKLLYIFLFLPVFLPAQVQMFFTSDSSAFIRSPLDVDSLFYWFDASQGVFDSIGSPISNFQGVGEWKDLSGRGHHVTQTTDGARPQYQATGGPNNYPALYFDGSNDFLASAAHLWESDDLTLFLVIRVENATRNAAELPIARRETSTGDFRQWDFRMNNTAASYTNELNVSQNGGSVLVNVMRFSQKSTTYKIITCVHPGNAAMSAWENQSSQTVTSTGTGNFTIYNYSQPFSIGSANPANPPSGPFNGYISEIIVYSRALTTAERGAIEAYLNHKYKIF